MSFNYLPQLPNDKRASLPFAEDPNVTAVKTELLCSIVYELCDVVQQYNPAYSDRIKAVMSRLTQQADAFEREATQRAVLQGNGPVRRLQHFIRQNADVFSGLAQATEDDLSPEKRLAMNFFAVTHTHVENVTSISVKELLYIINSNFRDAGGKPFFWVTEQGIAVRQDDEYFKERKSAETGLAALFVERVYDGWNRHDAITYMAIPFGTVALKIPLNGHTAMHMAINDQVEMVSITVPYNGPIPRGYAIGAIKKLYEQLGGVDFVGEDYTNTDETNSSRMQELQAYLNEAIQDFDLTKEEVEALPILSEDNPGLTNRPASMYRFNVNPEGLTYCIALNAGSFHVRVCMATVKAMREFGIKPNIHHVCRIRGDRHGYSDRELLQFMPLREYMQIKAALVELREYHQYRQHTKAQAATDSQPPEGNDTNQ